MMFNWFKKCKHEIDLENMEKPICVHCRKEQPLRIEPHFLAGYVVVNPVIESWRAKKFARILTQIYSKNREKAP